MCDEGILLWIVFVRVSTVGKRERMVDGATEGADVLVDMARRKRLGVCDVQVREGTVDMRAYFLALRKSDLQTSR